MIAHNKAKRRRERQDSRRATKQMLRDLAPGCAVAVTLIDSPWKDDDREWFAARPARSFRLRRLYPGEFPAESLGNATHVIVRQLAPGYRDKHLAGDACGGADLDALPDSETLAMILRDEFAKCAASGQAFMLQHTVDRARALDNLAGTGGVQ